MSLLRVFVLVGIVAEGVAAQDTLVYQLPTLTVLGRAVPVGERSLTASKIGLYEGLEFQGIGQLIRRGGVLSSDIYLQGFKRADVVVTVDGMRFPNACPNRMDAALSRVEPVDVDHVVVEYSGASVPGGLGGHLAYRRAPIQPGIHLRSELTGQVGAEPFAELSLLAQAHQQRITLRGIWLRSYTDGAGYGFGQRYGYTSEHIRSRWLDVSARGQIAALTYDARLAIAQDVPFPALMMDERRNTMGMLGVALGEHRLYAAYSWHRMDNGLRNTTMHMETDATTTAVGVSGPSYEVVYRFWKARNSMYGGTTQLEQNVIPSVHSARVAAEKHGYLGDFGVHLRLGAAVLLIGDTTRMAVYRELYPGVKRVRWYLPAGLSIGARLQGESLWQAAAQLELSSEAPAEEQLFFALKRMMGQPSVVGNPTLAQPVRVGLRTELAWNQWVRLHVAVSHVWDYPALTGRQVGMQRYQTYEGIRAALVAAQLSHVSEYAEVHVEYAWGEHLRKKTPLAEIAPATVSVMGKTPVVIAGARLWVRATYAAAQRRVDPSLSEQPTPDWFRLDAGVWAEPFSGLRLGMEVTNVLNRLYRRHLSYVRNPYAAGIPVYEPGRSTRIWAQYALQEQ